MSQVGPPPVSAPPPAREPAAEALRTWAALMGALVVAKLSLGFLPWGASIVGVLAVALFLWAPNHAARRAGRAEDDYGLDLQQWRGDVAFALAVMAVVFPVFAGGFVGFVKAAEALLPCDLIERMTPYSCDAFRLSLNWRLPSRLLDVVAGNVAVAVGEEYFYRGYMQERFERRWPPAARVFGVPFGRAALLQTALFAAGHLLTPAAFRLFTFFPGLLFTWMAVRRRRVLAAVIVHAASNIFIAFLEASAGFRP